MSKRALQVGDRVAFYTGRTRIVTEVKEVDADGYLLLKDHDRPQSMWVAHRCQVRRLVPRKRRERRRIWVNCRIGEVIAPGIHGPAYSDRESAEKTRRESHSGAQFETVEFREVPKPRHGGRGV